MGIMEKVREKAQSFLQINPPVASSINLQEYLDWEGNAIKNKIWYRGDGAELEQLYWQLVQFNTQRQMFWASHPTPGIEMRKIHTGLPSMIVDILVDIIKSAINDVNIIENNEEDNDESNVKDLWQEIEKENLFKSLVEKCLTDTLVIGDGAYKISIDKEISKYPIIEYYGGDKVSFRYNRGRLTAIIFKSIHNLESGTYELKEIYGKGFIDYELYRAGEPIELTIDPYFRELQRIEWDNDMMLAIPCMFYHNAKWEGRGQSIFDRRIDAFDSFDEAYSQWIDALRAGRTKQYIPESLIPRNPKSGKPIPANPFDNRFISTQADMKENGQNKIQTESATIQSDSYIATYTAALELCILKLISPSTLGIDVKKMDNAEAQREKEKVTLYTRDSIIEALTPVLTTLIETTIKSYYMMEGKEVPEFTVEVTFQSYANPSFESQIETVAKAKQAGIMSIEACIEELYGDDRDEQWKAQEIERLKSSNQIINKNGGEENDEMFNSQNREEKSSNASGTSEQTTGDIKES